MPTPLRVAFAPGVTPDKWAKRWRERRTQALELIPISEDQQEPMLREGAADLVLARLPANPADFNREGMHLIPLYEEQPVAVVAAEHPAAAYDDLALTDLAAEQLVLGNPPGWVDIRSSEPLRFEAMSVHEAIEVVASGTGFAVVPMSLARLHHRKDVTAVALTDVPTTRVGLAWLIARDDEEPLQFFIGIVRGRTAGSSRSAGARSPAPSTGNPATKSGRSLASQGPKPAGNRRQKQAGIPNAHDARNVPKSDNKPVTIWTFDLLGCNLAPDVRVCAGYQPPIGWEEAPPVGGADYA